MRFQIFLKRSGWEWLKKQHCFDYLGEGSAVKSTIIVRFWRSVYKIRPQIWIALLLKKKADKSKVLSSSVNHIDKDINCEILGSGPYNMYYIRGGQSADRARGDKKL